MTFTEEQIKRYSRHIILEGVGGKGQQKLLSSKVLIIGAGGLGSPMALYLAAAGVGTIGIADDDEVELSNLQRQILHHTDDLKKAKVESAKEKINKLNPDVAVVTYHERISSKNILRIIEDYDFILEGTDNFAAKFLINDACVMSGKPFSQGGILKFQGQTLTHIPGSACYRCVFEDAPPPGSVPSCSEAGVLGVTAGIIGTIQAAEALKFILDIGTTLANNLLMFDVLKMEFTKVRVERNPDCPICGIHPTILELQDYIEPPCDLEKPGSGQTSHAEALQGDLGSKHSGTGLSENNATEAVS